MASPILTLCSLFRKDLKEKQNYFLFFRPSSYLKSGYRFINKTKYRVFDVPTSALDYYNYQLTTQNLAAFGNDFVALVEKEPEELFKMHWRRWLPDFPAARVKSVEEGLKDGFPVVTWMPVECVPDDKHVHDPVMHYRIHLKSVIPEIGVPCPKYMSKESASFPCFVKPDQSSTGLYHQKAYNQEELYYAINRIEELWDGGYVIQEFLSQATKVRGYTLYLSKSGEVHWIGILTGRFTGFSWSGGIVDWKEQEPLQSAIREEFTIPICKFLLKEGYFGVLNFELMFTPCGAYLVDLNVRVGDSTTYLLIAPYMAEKGYTKSSMEALKHFKCSRQELVENADRINKRCEGMVLVMSAIDVDGGGCSADVAVYGRSHDDVTSMWREMDRD